MTSWGGLLVVKDHYIITSCCYWACGVYWISY